MAYRPSTTSYLIRDKPKKDIRHEEEEEEDDGERIEVDDDGSEFVRGSRRESGQMMGEYKKKYTFTTRKAATVYHCHECDKTFKHPSKIAEHLRKHTKERPFLCEVCGAQFTQGGSLKVHLRAHLGQLPYKCSYCDRHFATPYNQRNHEAVHIRGGRLHRDLSNRLSEKEDEARVKMETASGSQKRRTEEADQLYECCVADCGYQHTMKEMVENHVMSEHPPELWVTEEMEGEEVIEGEEGGEYQDYTFYEYVEGESLMEEQEVDVMTEDEVAAANAADDGREDHLSSTSPSLSSQLPLHSSMGVHSTVFHPSTSSGSALMIEADEHIDDDGMRKAMTDDGRTKRLRLLTLGRTGGGMVKDEELYPEETYSPPPLASYEVEVMTSQEETAAAAAAAAVSSTMDEDEEEDSQPVFTEMTRAQLIDEMEESTDDRSDRVRILADVRPPAKGRRPLSKWENLIEGMETDVDRTFLGEVMPQQPRSPRVNRLRKKRPGFPVQSRNLDWIIDAVAQGADVDSMSPHNRRKPQIHVCEYCGKTDKYPSKIQAHMRTHTGEKPYKCDFCGMGFAQKTPLRMHIRRHLNDRSFACEYEGCDAKFISQALLNAHTSSRHENTRRFVCMKGCGRMFVTGRNQRQHEQKCQHVIRRARMNTGYMNPEVRYEDDTAEDGDGRYLEEDEDVEVDDDDDYEGHEAIHLEGHQDDIDSIPRSYL